jgi:hypothetical protein
LLILLILFVYLYYNRNKALPFGSVLGQTKEGVIAYSNLQDDMTENKARHTGEKWQCVEFVRRFLIETRGITFESVPNAYNMWNLSTFYRDPKGSPVVIKKIEAGKSLPEKDDILVWDINIRNSGTGHTAIVTDVDKEYVYLAEQNWKNEEWGGNSYGRRIGYKNGVFIDPHLIGWIRV